MSDDERAAFATEVDRKAKRLLAELNRNIAAGKAEPGVVVCALMVTATNLAALHGTGPQTAAWLRSQIPQLEAMIATAERPN